MTRALFCLFWFWRLGNQRKWTPAPSCAQGQWFDTVCETLSPFSNVWHCCILIQTEWEVSSCQIIFISYLVMSIHFWGRWTLPEFKNSTPRVVFSIIIIIIMPVCGVQCTHSSQLHPGAVIWSQGCKAHGPQSMEMNLRVITSKCKHSAKHSDAHQEGAGLLWGMKRHPYAAYISWQLLGFIVAYSCLEPRRFRHLLFLDVLSLCISTKSIIKIALFWILLDTKRHGPLAIFQFGGNSKMCFLHGCDLWHLDILGSWDFRGFSTSRSSRCMNQKGDKR